MIDANTPASVKVRAAEAIFNHAAKAQQLAFLQMIVPGECAGRAALLSGRIVLDPPLI
jgi:hypothetical protein